LAPFEHLLLRLRALSPDAAIGADIIVGFPGETDEDFAILEAFLERSPLSYFHVFSYSPRRGTLAAEWPQVAETVKAERAKRLRGMSAAKNLAFRRSFLGQDLEAVVISAPSRPEFAGRGVVTSLETGDHTSEEVIARALAPWRETHPDPVSSISRLRPSTLVKGDLVEGNGLTELLTGNYVRVTVPNCLASRRDLVRVRITRVLPGQTEGVVV
jgi:hypothetical protein